MILKTGNEEKKTLPTFSEINENILSKWEKNPYADILSSLSLQMTDRYFYDFLYKANIKLFNLILENYNILVINLNIIVNYL